MSIQPIDHSLPTRTDNSTNCVMQWRKPSCDAKGGKIHGWLQPRPPTLLRNGGQGSKLRFRQPRTSLNIEYYTSPIENIRSNAMHWISDAKTTLNTVIFIGPHKLIEYIDFEVRIPSNTNLTITCPKNQMRQSKTRQVYSFKISSRDIWKVLYVCKMWAFVTSLQASSIYRAIY